MNDGITTTRPHGPGRALKTLKVARASLFMEGQEDGFELNTDFHLLEQEWGDFEERHDQRYGLAIEHLKARVKGRAYDNEAMRLRVGAQGYYVQSRRFPAAFYGDTGHASVSTVSSSEAAATVWEAVAHYRSDEARSLTAVYEGKEPQEFFFGYAVDDFRRYEVGRLRRSLPIHLRVLFGADTPVPLLGATGGVLIYQRTKAGEHVLVRAKGRRRPLLNPVAFG